MQSSRIENFVSSCASCTSRDRTVVAFATAHRLHNQCKSGDLRWAKGWSGYGFPVPNNIRGLLLGDEKLVARLWGVGSLRAIADLAVSKLSRQSGFFLEVERTLRGALTRGYAN